MKEQYITAGIVNNRLFFIIHPTHVITNNINTMNKFDNEVCLLLYKLVCKKAGNTYVNELIICLLFQKCRKTDSHIFL